MYRYSKPPAQTEKPQPYGLGIDPCGMSFECKQRWGRIVEAYGLVLLDPIKTRYGDIFIAERYNPLIATESGLITGGWDVAWATREVAHINLEFRPSTTREQRVEQVRQWAMEWLIDRARNLGERVFDA